MFAKLARLMMLVCGRSGVRVVRMETAEQSEASIIASSRTPIAKQKHIRLWVAQRSQPVAVLLAGCVPEAQVYGFTIHHHVRRIIIEDCRWGW